MKYLRWFFPVVTVFLLSGCFQVMEVLHLNPDGSGTVEERMLMSKKFFAGMDQMMSGFSGEGNAKHEPIELFDPAKLREQAAAMGEGVSYLSGKKVETADFTGYTAVYAFTDINKLNFNRQGAALGAPVGDGQPAQMLRFHFTRKCPGSPATLTIEQPAGKKPAAAPSASESPAPTAPAPPGAAPDEEAVKLAKMFMGMKFVLAIDINGDIVSTNATYRDGNRIIILDFDMEKLGNSLSGMEKLDRLKTGSLGDAKELLKDIPGMKVDMNDKLTVVFDK